MQVAYTDVDDQLNRMRDTNQERRQRSRSHYSLDSQTGRRYRLIIIEQCFFIRGQPRMAPGQRPRNADHDENMALCKTFEEIREQGWASWDNLDLFRVFNAKIYSWFAWCLSVQNGIYEVNGICIPRRPDTAQFQADGGYPILWDHRHEASSVVMAGFGDLGWAFVYHFVFHMLLATLSYLI